MRKLSWLSLAGAALAGALGACRSRPRPISAASIDPTYAIAVQPLFDRRCVPCHACYDSACQLTLQSFEGLDRGANKSIVYHPERAVADRTTRMFQDAQTTAAWQSEFDFFPVVDRTHPGDLSRSILWRFVSQRNGYPLGGYFDVDKTTTCPRSLAELDDELRQHPERGMPFGFPPLTGAESATIAAWLRGGAGGPVSPSDDAERDEIGQWEDFFNGTDPRTPLVSAYLFEHLFYAHLRFDAAGSPWFRLVRSRTPKGVPVDEIATRRPYDDPECPRPHGSWTIQSSSECTTTSSRGSTSTETSSTRSPRACT